MGEIRRLRPTLRGGVTLLTLGALVVGGAACSTADENDAPAPAAEVQSAPQSPQSSEPEETEDREPAEDAQQDADSATAPATDEGVPETIDGAPWTTDPTEVERSSIAPQPTLITGLRVGEHDGFDRVVIDLTGNGPVGYSVRWVDTPREQARGEVLALGGNAFLSVNVTGTSIPMNDEEYALYYDVTEAQTAGGIEAIYDSSFEGRTHVVIGMGAKHPYRVFVLENPLRVVVDVQN